jgi:hypothetical protein
MMSRTGTLAATALALLMAQPTTAQRLPETRVTVIGNFGITTQSRTLEAPFWNPHVPQASGQRITVNFRPGNEAGLRGPEVFRILARGQAPFGPDRVEGLRVCLESHAERATRRRRMMAEATVASKSLERRRFRPIQAKKRSTTQRRACTAKPT